MNNIERRQCRREINEQNGEYLVGQHATKIILFSTEITYTKAAYKEKIWETEQKRYGWILPGVIMSTKVSFIRYNEKLSTLVSR